jgi:hypothetical protein
MRRSTYEALCRLHECHGPREFGKLSQKLLAISYRLAGYLHVQERGVQGVDVDAANGGQKYANEVKTTLTEAVVFQDKDVRGLQSRRADGYQPVLAVLRLSPLSDWLLVPAKDLQSGRLVLETLRPYRLHSLEKEIHPQFNVTVAEHIEGTLTGAQGYLDKVLHQMGIAIQDSSIRPSLKQTSDIE